MSDGATQTPENLSALAWILQSLEEIAATSSAGERGPFQGPSRAFSNADNGCSLNLLGRANPGLLIPRPELAATLIRPWPGAIQVIHGWKWEPLG